MKFGVQYYPEHWPRERWPIDAEMMQRAGVNVVRMGEFAWSAYETHEGVFDFSWMEEAIALFARHGIQTILCTCSRTPPPWVYAKYPDIANVWKDGKPSTCDSRYGVAIGHPEFIALSQKIDEKIIRHFAGNKNIVAWQIDNEIGSANDSYSPSDHQKFQAYLQEKYGSPEALNAAWGRHFWSLTFTDFKEVPLPKQNPQIALEYRRFLSAMNVSFTARRADLIHRCDPGKPITTNFQNLYASHTDYNELARIIDVSGMNHYPTRTPELAIDYYRGAGDTVWALEQHTRLGNVDTPDGRMRLWAWMTIAHGANALVYFRWRQCRWGNEQFGDGLLPHSGQANRFYRDLSRLGSELATVGAAIEATRPRASVAIVMNYESRWSLEAAKMNRALEPVDEAATYHEALSKHVTAIDALEPMADLSPYALVIAPRLWMVTPALANHLSAYVANGGTLCLTAGSGMVDEYGASFPTPRPGLLNDLTGITISDFACDKHLQLPLESTATNTVSTLQAALVAEEMHPTTAEVVAAHSGGWRNGLPAITRNRVGKGQVIYVGVGLDTESVAELVRWLCLESGVPQGDDRPDGISVYERVGNDQKFLFIINWSDHPHTMTVDEGWRDAFSAKPEEAVHVAANDLRILTQETQTEHGAANTAAAPNP